MEDYTTQDKQVVKYVHNDGSETAIKTVSSCDNILNQATGEIEPIKVDRNKFSCFISSSVGCPIGCKFCYLTVKNFPYVELSKESIYQNVKNALWDRIVHKREWRTIGEQYMKLSWMGMGDAFLLKPNDVLEVTRDLIEWSLEHNLVKGIDGVDISTVLPKKKWWPCILGTLNLKLLEYPVNPTSKDRSRVRLFYSLHHCDLIPMSRNFLKDLSWLKSLEMDFGVDVIIHHMFIEGVNDTDHDVENLHRIFRKYKYHPELRILRYNECPNSPYKESPRFNELVRLCSETFRKIKYQVSAGSEIKAACGQFLCKTLK